MLNIQTIIASVVSVYGIKALGFVAKSSIFIVKQKIGDKKYNKLVIQGKKVIEDSKQLAKDLGIDDDIANIKSIAIDKLCFVTRIDKDKAKQIISEVLKEVMDTSTSETIQPADKIQQVIQ